MKKLKKKWEQELEQCLPPLREDVRCAPIPCKAQKEKKNFASLFRAFGKKWAIPAGALALILVLCLTLPTTPTDTPTTPVGHPAAVMLEINPGAVFSVDETGKVVQVIAANADADVILSQEARRTALIGVPISDAVKTFVDYSVQLGYLNLSENAIIRISSCEQVQENSEDLTATLRQELETYFRQEGAYVAVAAERMAPSDFCRRAGLADAQSVEALTQELSTLSAFYFERHREQWEESYAQAVDVSSRLEQIVQRLEELPFISESLKNQLLEDISGNLRAIFELLGISTEKLSQFETPTSYEEYLQRIREYCEEKYRSNEQAPDDKREQLTVQQYDAFVHQIIEKYGSLQAYWESKK